MFSHKWSPLAAICLGTCMLLLDTTIVNVALPAMVADLGASFAALQWVVNAYALVLAALLLATGSLADRVGRRRTYLAGLAVFALASLACGLAPSPTALVAARGVQGLGAAAMLATTLALLHGAYRERDRGLAFGVWSAVAAAATAAGPIAGGLLTQALSWRWIFFVNLPLSALALALAARAVAESRAPGRAGLDLAGAASFTLAAATATAALVQVSDAGWGAPSTLGLLALAAGALAAFVVRERRTARPLLDLALLRRGVFSGVLLGATFLSVAAFATLVYASLWLQGPLGLGPIQAGLVLLPMPVASFLVAVGAGRFLHGTRAHAAIGLGLLVAGAGDLLQVRLGAGSDGSALLAGLAVAGVGVGLATPTLASVGMAAVPPQASGTAAGAVNTARQLGLALGVALLGSVYHDQLGPEGSAGALATTFLVAGIAGIGAGIGALVLLRRPVAHAPSVPTGRGVRGVGHEDDVAARVLATVGRDTPPDSGPPSHS